MDASTPPSYKGFIIETGTDSYRLAATEAARAEAGENLADHHGCPKGLLMPP